MPKWTWADMIAHMGTYTGKPSAGQQLEMDDQEIANPEETVYNSLNLLFLDLYSWMREEFGNGESSK